MKKYLLANHSVFCFIGSLLNLPADKCPKDTAGPQLPPPTYSVPPAPHVEPVNRSHRYRRNQPSKGPTVSCC